MSLLSETLPHTPKRRSDEDYENCKGQCGYTVWCRACMEETKKLIREAELREIERRENDHADEKND
jgi:hypothetical protein